MPRDHSSKFVRIPTKVPASSLHFPEEDAYGDRPLPPVRKIALGRRALTGLMTANEKGPGPAMFESSLERDYLVLLEFDPEVASWEPQPVRLRLPATNGGRPSTYTPDVLVHRRNGGSPVSELVEIKYWDEVKETWPDLRRKIQAARDLSREKGWRFRLVTDKFIRRPRLYNAKFLLPYRDEEFSPEDVETVVTSLLVEEITTPARVMSRISKEASGQLKYYGVLWMLMARHWVQWWPDYELTLGVPIKLTANPLER